MWAGLFAADLRSDHGLSGSWDARYARYFVPAAISVISREERRWCTDDSVPQQRLSWPMRRVAIVYTRHRLTVAAVVVFARNLKGATSE